MDNLVRASREPEFPAARHYPAPERELPDPGGTRVRSQAERDLLRALRVTR
jgi:hypothetical protein